MEKDMTESSGGEICSR